jgi:hypothetical protein
MMANLRMFGGSLHLLIGLLIVAAVVLVVILVAWTTFNVAIWRSRREKADQAERRRRFRPDGQPYPPAGRGLCDSCARGFDKVYYLPSGRRLCPECYERCAAAGDPGRPAEGA